MPTITVLIKTQDQFGIGAICCGPKIISDNLLFIPPNIFGSIQASFSETNCHRVKYHFQNGGEFDNINNNDTLDHSRQYVFFENGTIKTYTGDNVKNAYTKFNNNIVVCANRVGKPEYGNSLFNSLVKHYSDNVKDCIINSFRENKHVGFDNVCTNKNISSTTLHISVYNKIGGIIYNKEIYSPNQEPIDML